VLLVVGIGYKLQEAGANCPSRRGGCSVLILMVATVLPHRRAPRQWRTPIKSGHCPGRRLAAGFQFRLRALASLDEAVRRAGRTGSTAGGTPAATRLIRRR